MSDVRAGSLVGPYTILEALPQGRGGMARVCKASLPLPDGSFHLVALKIMRTQYNDPQEEQFFRDAINNEVEVLKRLRHPNVVRVYPIPLGSRKATPYIARDTDMPGAPWYFVMEYLDGGSLDGMIKRRKQLPVKEAVEVACQVAMALEHLHSKGIAHRDIKPDNVLFRVDPETTGRVEPVLVDFGIAAKLQRVGLQAGSIFYMSPERVQVVHGMMPPERVVNQAAGDVYGLGVILYQMLTGRRPFEGHSRSSVTSAILNTTPALPRRYRPEIPPGLEQLIMEMMHKDPARRPSSAEVLANMEQLVPAPRVAPRDVSAPVRSGNRLPWVITALTTLGMIGALVTNPRIQDSITGSESTAVPTAIVTEVPSPDETPAMELTDASGPSQEATEPAAAPTETPTRTAVPPTEAPTKRATPTSVPTRTPRPTRTPEPPPTATGEGG
jgi:serine/threonine protein kinase